MDYFNLLIGILLVFLAFQLKQDWIVFLIVIVLIITMKSFTGSILLIAVSAFLYFFAAGSSLKDFFLPVLAVLIVIAVIAHLRQKQKPAEMFPGDAFGSYGGMDDLGGGGYGGYGGLGGGGY